MEAMEIILLEKIPKLGNLGDKVKVKRGYARNYLLPQKKARRATKEAIAEFEAQRAEREKAAAEKLAAATAQGEKLTGHVIKITQKAGIDGRLFGSVTSADVVQALKAQDVTVEKSQIRFPAGLIKTVGDHPAQIILHTDVTVEVTVSVVGEHV